MDYRWRVTGRETGTKIVVQAPNVGRAEVEGVATLDEPVDVTTPALGSEMRPCPDCGELHDPKGMGSHRAQKHGET